MRSLPPKTQWLITLLVLWGLPSISVSQSIDRQVFGASGTQAIQGNLALDYTVGEAVIHPLSNHGILLTQGFHQPLLDSVVQIIPISGDLKLRLFPNPFSDWITLVPEGEGYRGALLLRLYDLQGKLVHADHLILSDAHTIRLPNLPAGHYAIHLLDKAQRPVWTGVLQKAK
jgi:hypothetical protein